MSDKKHIDRLFQERFKDFEATPSDAVWENIESQLNKKNKKRRVIPIWWRYAGAAAILLLLLTVGNNVFNTTSENQNIEVVETEDETSSKLKKEHNNEVDNSSNKSLIKDDNILQEDLDQNKTVIANNNDTKDKEGETQKTSNNTKTNNAKQSTGIAKTNSLNKSKINNSKQLLSNKNSNNNSPSTLNLEEHTVISSNSKKENNTLIDHKKDDVLIDIDKSKNIINNLSENTTITKNESVKENDNESALLNNDQEKDKLTIEEVLDKNKDIIEEDSKLNRWRIAANAAPVYFNSINEDGSSIDSQFNNNSKTGEVSMSYGISTSYAINKKLSIRSGINKVNLGYNTNNVVVFQSISSRSSSALMNVDATPNNNSTEDILTGAATQETFSVISADGLNNTESFNTTSLNQSLGYIEVPLEIQYTLSNKKLGVNVIGGFSSFFLDDNKIFSENSDGARTLLGEATNINKVSYSANFGLGLNYEISKIIDLNLEPMFKYQINTFNNTTGDFKPYILGVYTGFVIKF